MYINSKIIFLFFVLIIVGRNTNAQDSLDIKPDEYSLVIYGGGGLSYYLNNPGVPLHLNTTVTRQSASTSLRLMWHPDHRLRFGLETGYLNLYNYKINSENIGGKLRLTAVPLLIVWSMQIGKRINIFAGSGTYFIKSRLDYAGHSEAGNLSLGWMAAASYNFNISNSFSITPELKWFDASESGHQSLNLQMLFAWKFYKW